MVILKFLKIISCWLVIFLVIVNLISYEGIASDGELTLKEAIDIGLQRAKEWNGKATLTSVNSVDETKEKYGLKQGKDWATGYHFTLDNIDGAPILTVVGNDRDNRFTRISVNVQNGDVVSAIHIVPYGGGLLYKRNGTDNLTKKGMAITGVVAGNNNLVVWGDKKPTQFSITNEPFIE